MQLPNDNLCLGTNTNCNSNSNSNSKKQPNPFNTNNNNNGSNTSINNSNQTNNNNNNGNSPLIWNDDQLRLQELGPPTPPSCLGNPHHDIQIAPLSLDHHHHHHHHRSNADHQIDSISEIYESKPILASDNIVVGVDKKFEPPPKLERLSPARQATSLGRNSSPYG